MGKALSVVRTPCGYYIVISPLFSLPEQVEGPNEENPRVTRSQLNMTKALINYFDQLEMGDPRWVWPRSHRTSACCAPIPLFLYLLHRSPLLTPLPSPLLLLSLPPLPSYGRGDFFRGTVLCFLPGMPDIRDLEKVLQDGLVAQCRSVPPLAQGWVTATCYPVYQGRDALCLA